MPGIVNLTAAIIRLADVLERNSISGLGGREKIAYTPASVVTEMSDEKTMMG